MSIFVNSTRYGLNLANFFPAVLHQKNWMLVAEVRIGKNKTYTLELNQDCHIRSHYKHFLSYVPKEIDLLSKQIEIKIPALPVMARPGSKIIWQLCFFFNF